MDEHVVLIRQSYLDGLVADGAAEPLAFQDAVHVDAAADHHHRREHGDRDQQTHQVQQVSHDQHTEDREHGRKVNLALHDHRGHEIGLHDVDDDAQHRNDEEVAETAGADYEERGQQRGDERAEERDDRNRAGEHAEGEGVGHFQDHETDPGENAERDHGEDLAGDP